MSSVITNRTVKPFVKAVDLYPGFALEEEVFSKAVIKDINEPKFKKKSSKSDIDQEGPTTWPREKSTKQMAYEQFLSDTINEDIGEFYPEKDDHGVAIKGSGCTYYINAIYRIRRTTGEEFLYTKGMAYGFNKHGDSIHRAISTPEIWTKYNFSYKTEYNDKTKEMEKVLQGPSGSEEIYLKPFNKENLKELFERRQNDLVQLAVKKEGDSNATEVKDVTGNITKSYELFRDQNFDYLITAQYMPVALKAEYRQQAIDRGLLPNTNAGIQGTTADSTNTTPKNTYQ